MPTKNSGHTENRHDIFTGFYHTAEWMITAFAVTLVFIVFVMQAYTIPTGSMADTLRGAHFRLICKQCGYRYEHGFVPTQYGWPENSFPPDNTLTGPGQLRCPSCGCYPPNPKRDISGKLHISPDVAERIAPVMKGDRIFVLKSIYQFADPDRWDFIVFKNPLDPSINYIKRLVARPGETIEIINGDVYINNRIARKPPAIQEELWMCVYNNDYQPIRPDEKQFNGHRWQQPFANAEDSNWDLTPHNGTVFALDDLDDPDRINTITYDTNIGNDFRATYAYDEIEFFPAMPICSDLMVRFDVRLKGPRSVTGASLTKYGIDYRGWISNGKMMIEKIDKDGTTSELTSREFTSTNADLIAQFKFANVDHQLILEFGNEKLTFDLSTAANDAGQIQLKMPKVAILGSGTLQLSRIGIFRDIHYLTTMPGGKPILRAGPGDPFTLSDDEFFVLGDNSPASLDARLWNRPGLGNNNGTYRPGTVPRDYLIGKAFFVYWPGPFKPYNGSKLAKKMNKKRPTRILKILLNIPYIEGMKAIKGGRKGY